MILVFAFNQSVKALCRSNDGIAGVLAWEIRREQVSPCYTIRLCELATVCRQKRRAPGGSASSHLGRRDVPDGTLLSHLGQIRSAGAS